VLDKSNLSKYLSMHPIIFFGLLKNWGCIISVNMRHVAAATGFLPSSPAATKLPMPPRPTMENRERISHSTWADDRVVP
jgi:hypothetical protein